MLVLAKATMAMMLGFILSILTGIIIIPWLRKLNAKQSVSLKITKTHLAKNGTPTLGGFIFIIPTIISIFLLYLKGSINITHNLIILLFVFLSYAILGFVDDFLKIKYKNNKGLKISTKFFFQLLIAIVFFYIFMKNGGKSVIEITSLGLTIPLGWGFGLFILFLLVGTSNAVNITDGLDGLAGGLSSIAFLAFGLLSWNTSWMQGNQELAIFCFILVGSLLGFLLFNSHPAKVFMGDMGSLALGAALATIAILTRHELSLALIGGVFVVEALSSLIQIVAIKKFHKKVFKMAPLHHHFELSGWRENKVVIVFCLITLLACVIGLQMV